MNQSDIILKTEKIDKNLSILERNKNIALFCEHPFVKKWYDTNKKNGKDETFPYHLFDYNNNYGHLMSAVEKMREFARKDERKIKKGEYIIDRFEIRANSIYISVMQWLGNKTIKNPNSGWRMGGDKGLVIYYVDAPSGNVNSFKEALFMAVSDFAALVNKSKKDYNL